MKNQKIKIPSLINSIKIIHMSKNKGHARCNAFGIKYLSENSDFDYLILMDGDGEDRPEEIKLLVDKVLLDPNKSVVAKRVKRSEGFIFQMLYRFHKYLTLFTTCKLINFGNYSCLTKNDLKTLSTKASLWSSFSGSFKYNIKNYNEVNSIRGMRYFGPTQMSLFKLVIHSFSIIAVFKYRLFFISLALLASLHYLGIFIKFNFLLFQILTVLFNILVFIVSFRESEKDLRNSKFDIAKIENFTH
tara:strand:- start:884 stop:1618 length:735 start_codon:yes stop_codon:yes gene_type:complete